MIYHHTITLKESLCGFIFEIKYINGKIFKINNAGGNIINTKYKKVVQGYGMKREDQSGNLIICFDIIYPDKLTDAQVTALEKIL